MLLWCTSFCSHQPHNRCVTALVAYQAKLTNKMVKVKQHVQWVISGGTGIVPFSIQTKRVFLCDQIMTALHVQTSVKLECMTQMETKELRSINAAYTPTPQVLCHHIWFLPVLIMETDHSKTTINYRCPLATDITVSLQLCPFFGSTWAVKCIKTLSVGRGRWCPDRPSSSPHRSEFRCLFLLK